MTYTLGPDDLPMEMFQSWATSQHALAAQRVQDAREAVKKGEVAAAVGHYEAALAHHGDASTLERRVQRLAARLAALHASRLPQDGAADQAETVDFEEDADLGC